MAYNRRSGGGYGSGARYNSGGGYRGSAVTGPVNPWQSSGPMGRQSQQAGPPPPAQLAMASSIISKLLSSSSSMSGSSHWNPRLPHFGIRKQDGNSNKNNRRRNGDSHKFSGRKSGGVAKDGDKHKFTEKINDENKKGQKEYKKTKERDTDADKSVSYVGVPSAVLYCHVCSKHMWDCESFEKHIRGRPHELMMTYLDETYKMRVDFMRHQIKAVENQREIDLERVTNKIHKSNTIGNKFSGGNSVSKPLLRSYCPMCDVRFYGPLTGHRKSDRHRKLKQFLHPECKLCDALFHTRLEMDEHKLTAGHLKKIAEVRNVENPHFKNDEFNLIDMIKIEEEQIDSDQMPVAKKYEMLGDRDITKLKLELEGANSEKNKNHTLSGITVPADSKEENKTHELESSDTVVSDTVTNTSIKENITTELPSKNTQTVAYNPNIALGKELLISSKGYVCRLCNCFLMDQPRVSIHCQTAAHYINYTTMTKMNEASGFKKRGIDLVNDDDGNEITNEKEMLQEAEITLEEPVVKRIKLEDEKTNQMEVINEQLLQPKIEVCEVKEQVDKKDEIVVQPVSTEAKPSPRCRGRGGRGVGGVARRARR